jgi:hypothetical protein
MLMIAASRRALGKRTGLSFLLASPNIMIAASFMESSELTIVEDPNERSSALMEIDTTCVSENTPMPDASPAQGG